MYYFKINQNKTMKIERNGACEIQGDYKLTNNTESVMQHNLIEKRPI